MKELAPFGGAVAEPFARPEAVARLREIVARPAGDAATPFSRIRLPSELRRIFQTMAFGGHRPPRRFLRWEALYRALFWIHTKSRPLRHPRRWWRARRRPAAGDDYPAAKSLWIWDERSGQAIGTMRKGERYLLHSIVSGLQTSFRTALVFFPAWAAYFRRRRRCYTGPVALAGRVGMTIHPRPESVERELELLRGLGKIPVLLRYYRHEGEAAWDSVSGVVRRLHDDGHPVSIALVQDRRAVEQPELWRDFVERVLGDVGGIVEYAEVGHGLNRVKWGLWSLAEYAALLRPCRDLQERFPRVGFLGPAVYDFEYHYVASTLWSVPRRLRLAALSLHLYVDRRGAPENRQYSFSTLDKFVMARAITRVSPRCEQKVVVTEVNWPLRDTGVHSPVVAPYQSKDPPRVDANVSEDEYADYMLRYYLIALCSGMVERVYWWRLRAEGFGLVADDGRLRPAYVMLREFLRRFGASTFRERPAAPDGVELFRFDAGVVAYTTAETACEYEPGFPVAEAVSATGDAVAAAGGRYRLTGRPLYLLTSSS